MKVVNLEDITKEELVILIKDDGVGFNPQKSKIVKSGNKVIGYYTVHILLNRLTLEYTLLKEYRNHGYGNLFVDFVTKMVEDEYPSYEKIYLLINYANEVSRNVAIKNNYSESKDYDFIEKVLEEMSGYELLDKDNEKYKQNKQLLHKL